jgi:hypothetical protein
MNITKQEASELRDHAARLIARTAARAADGRMRPAEVARTIGELVHLVGRLIAALDADPNEAAPKPRKPRKRKTETSEAAGE